MKVVETTHTLHLCFFFNDAHWNAHKSIHSSQNHDLHLHLSFPLLFSLVYGFKLVLNEKQTLPAPHTDSTHLWEGLGHGAWLAVHEVNPSGAALPEDPHTGEQILLK